jgi:hypothetical protein
LVNVFEWLVGWLNGRGELMVGEGVLWEGGVRVARQRSRRGLCHGNVDI